MGEIIPQRKQIRLHNYDYSQTGLYFVTICTQNRVCLFGSNMAGEMIAKWWLELKNKFPNIDLDEYVVMPNHIHGIIQIVGDTGTKLSVITGEQPVGADLRVCPPQPLESGEHPLESGEHPLESGEHIGSPLRRICPNIPEMIQWFKTMSTNEYIRGVKSGKFPPFEKSIWQRNYYEHIIRTENDLNNIRLYIKENPNTWNRDNNNSIYKNSQVV